VPKISTYCTSIRIFPLKTVGYADLTKYLPRAAPADTEVMPLHEIRAKVSIRALTERPEIRLSLRAAGRAHHGI